MTARTNNRAGPIITSAGLTSEEIHRPRGDTAGERDGRTCATPPRDSPWGVKAANLRGRFFSLTIT